MNSVLLKLFLAAIMIVMISCGAQTNMVESGEHQCTVKKVVPAEKEIYVETVDGKTLELYFTDETQLTQNGESVEFSALKEGQTVTVHIKKVGKRLDPLSVEIKE
jgi:cold shock protein